MEDSDVQLVQQMIQQSIKQSASDSKFSVVDIPAHQHTGVDSNRVSALNLTDLNLPNILRVFSTTSTGNFATGTTGPLNVFAPNANMVDLFDVNSATGAVTFNNPVGDPKNGQVLNIRVTSSNSATARSLTFSNSTGGYIAVSPALPSATTTGQATMLGFMFDTTNSLNKWRLFYSASA